MKRNIKIKNTLFISLLITATVAILTISIFWILNEINESKSERKNLRDKSLKLQKGKLEREVNNVLDYIIFTHNQNQDLPLQELQNKILDYISSIRFGSGGYIFVNKVDGQALIFDGKKLTEYKNNIDLKDTRGNSILQPQIEAFYKGEEGGFMQYYFKRIEGFEEESKISYMKGYHAWDWIIGAGDYLRDIDNEIIAHENNLKKQLKIRIIFILVLFTILVIGIAYISFFLSTYINKEFAVFKNYFSHSTGNDSIDTIDYSSLTIVELQAIADTVNKMVKEVNSTTVLLKESEEKFRTFIENSADAIFISDFEGNYQYVNKKASELLGYSQEELMAMSIFDLASKKDLEEHAAIFKSLSITRKMFIEINLLKKDKTLVPVDLNTVILPDGNIFGSCRNISKRKNAETELHIHQTKLEELVNNRTLELEEKNTELERFNKLFIGREFRIKELKDKLKRYEGGE